MMTFRRQQSRKFLVMAAAMAAAGCANCTSTSRVAMSVAPWAGDGFAGRQVSTPHYTLFSTLRDKAFEVQVAKRMELVYARLADTVCAGSGLGSPLKAYLLGTASDYARFVAREYPARSLNVDRRDGVGFADGASLVVAYTDRAGMLTALAHHGWHQYIASRCRGQLPAWLDEGLACEVEALAFVADKRAVRVKRNPVRIATLRELLRRSTNASLAQVVARDRLNSAAPGGGHYDESFQAQAWAVVSLLRDGGGGRYAGRFDRMLRDITDGSLAVKAGGLALTSGADAPISPGEAVLRIYFGKSSAELEDIYFDHIVRLCGF